MDNSDQFNQWLQIMCSPHAPLSLRTDSLQGFKASAKAYIYALKGAQDNTVESDPLHQKVTDALREIETVLMDR